MADTSAAAVSSTSGSGQITVPVTISGHGTVPFTFARQPSTADVTDAVNHYLGHAATPPTSLPSAGASAASSADVPPQPKTGPQMPPDVWADIVHAMRQQATSSDPDEREAGLRWFKDNGLPFTSGAAGTGSGATPLAPPAPPAPPAPAMVAHHHLPADMLSGTGMAPAPPAWTPATNTDTSFTTARPSRLPEIPPPGKGAPTVFSPVGNYLGQISANPVRGAIDIGTAALPELLPSIAALGAARLAGEPIEAWLARTALGRLASGVAEGAAPTAAQRLAQMGIGGARVALPAAVAAGAGTMTSIAQHRLAQAVAPAATAAYDQRLAEIRQRDPIGYYTGGALPFAALTGGVGEMNAASLPTRATGAALQPAIQAAQSLATTGHLPSVQDTVAAALTGAALAGEGGLARRPAPTPELPSGPPPEPLAPMRPLAVAEEPEVGAASETVAPANSAASPSPTTPTTRTVADAVQQRFGVVPKIGTQTEIAGEPMVVTHIAADGSVVLHSLKTGEPTHITAQRWVDMHAQPPAPQAGFGSHAAAPETPPLSVDAPITPTPWPRMAPTEWTPRGTAPAEPAEAPPVHHSQLQPRDDAGRFDGPPVPPPAAPVAAVPPTAPATAAPETAPPVATPPLPVRSEYDMEAQNLPAAGTSPVPDTAAPTAATLPAPVSAPPAASANTAEPEYAGSINLDRTSLDDAGKQAVRDSIARQSLEEHGSESRDRTTELARGLNVTAEELGNLRPGEHRAGLDPALYPAWDKAVRDLGDFHAAVEAQASRDHADGPTPETQAALDQARAQLDTVTRHNNELAYAAGKRLSDRAGESSPFQGIAADDILRPASEEPAKVGASAAMSNNFRRARNVNPTDPDFLSKNKVFTADRVAAAKARLSAQVRQMGSQTNAIAGLEPRTLIDLVEIGGGYLEAGLRQYRPWRDQMEKDVREANPEIADKISQGGWQSIWANVRAEANRRVTTGGGTRSSEAVFVEQMGRRLGGTENAAKFVNALNQRGGGESGNDLLDKVLASGGNFANLTADERAEVHQAMTDTAAPRTGSRPTPTGPMRTIDDIWKEGQAARGPQRVGQLTKPPVKTVDDLVRNIASRPGMSADRAAAMREALRDPDGGESLLTKFLQRPDQLNAAQRERFARAWIANERPRGKPAEQQASLKAVGKALGETRRLVNWERSHLDTPMTWQNRLRDNLGDLVNVPHTLKASFDLSAPGRQAAILTVAHPVMALKAARASLSAFRTANFETLVDQLRARPNNENGLYEKSGLFLRNLQPERHGLNGREEAFLSRAVAEKVAPVRASEHAYTMYLDSMRADAFDAYATALHRHGITPENSPEAYQAVGRWVNAATGRGEIGGTAGNFLNRHLAAVNGLLFSPRMMASHIQILSGEWARYPAPVRQMAVRDLLRFAGAYATTLTLAHLAGMKVGLNPADPDFGKIRSGKWSYDVSGGFQSYVRFLFREIGAISQGVRGERPNPSGVDLGVSFLRGKLAPGPAFAANAMTGRNMAGEPFSAPSELAHLATPMFLDDLMEGWKADGAAGAVAALPSLVGISASPREEKQDGKLPPSLGLSGLVPRAPRVSGSDPFAAPF